MPKRNHQSTTTLRCPESVFECQLCMDEFRSPRVLPCQHIFCRNCVVKLAKRSDNTAESWYKCPVCRQSWSADSAGFGGDKTIGFPESLLMKNLIGYRKDHGVKFRDAFVNTEIRTTTASTQTEDVDDRRVMVFLFILLGLLSRVQGYAKRMALSAGRPLGLFTIVPMILYRRLQSVQRAVEFLIQLPLDVPRKVWKWYVFLFCMCGMINTYFYYAHDIHNGLRMISALISGKMLFGVFLWIAVIIFICCIFCMDLPHKAIPSHPRRRKPRTYGFFRTMQLRRAKENDVHFT